MGDWTSDGDNDDLLFGNCISDGDNDDSLTLFHELLVNRNCKTVTELDSASGAFFYFW